MNTVIGSSIGGATIIYEILALAGVRYLLHDMESQVDAHLS